MTEPHSLRPRLQVNLEALRQNYETLRAHAGAATLACTVKADAYGLGMKGCAPALYEAGARQFFVAYSFEGAALRDLLGPEADIHVFNGPAISDLSVYETHRLTPGINALEQLAIWKEAINGPCILHIDTAMNRLGLSFRDVETVLANPGLVDGLSVTCVMSHLACGSDPASPRNEAQAQLFTKILAPLKALFPEAAVSLSASAGLYLDLPVKETLVRPGIALYGAGPQDKTEADLKTVATLQAPILQVRTIEAGETVGYGATYKATGQMTLATLGIGYGDGFARRHGDHAKVVINGQLCPVVGRVSMDLMTVDISHLEDRPLVGTYAEIFGTSRHIEDAAAAIDTIAYELLVTLGARVARIYG